MTLRKKKVEATLDKLFSTSKPKTEGVEGPTPEAKTESPLPQGTRGSGQVKKQLPNEKVTPFPPAQEQKSENTPTEVQAVETPPPPIQEAPSAISATASSAIGETPPAPSTVTVPDPVLPAQAPKTAGLPQPSTTELPATKKLPSDGAERGGEAETVFRREVTTEDICQLVIFTLAGEAFGLPIERVESIIKPQAITVVPHARPYVVGVTNLRGTVLPVIDLRRRFHLPAGEESEDQRIVVVMFNDEKIGLQVDSVTQVYRLPLSSIEPPPPIVTAFVHSAFVTGIAKVDERLVILLDLEKVLLPGDGN